MTGAACAASGGQAFGANLRSAGAALLLALLLLGLTATVMPAAAAMLPAEEAPQPAAPAEPAIEAERASGQDAMIVERISGIFSELSSLAGIEVEASEGVVTLSGSAPDAAAVERAEAIAGRVSGVVTVENNIERDVSVGGGLGLGPLQEKAGEFTRLIPLIGAALLVALLIAGVGYLLASFTGLWRRIAPNSFLAELIASAIRFVFVVGGMVIALDMIGAGALLGAVLGGAGVIGIALGFAMRDTIENYVASLMLSLRQPFRANDHVLIDDREGRVIRLTSRATILMTLDGNHLRIPNSSVFKAIIVNYTRNPQRRFDFQLGIDADDDIDAARRLGHNVLATMDFVLAEPPPEVRVVEVGDSNVLLCFLGWIDQVETDFLKARSKAIAITKRALEDAGFALPEPIYRLRFDPRTTPLPFASVDGDHKDRTAAPPPPAAPAPASPAPSSPVTGKGDAPAHEDLAPQEEIARMVNKERAQSSGGQEQDLLDSSRPVE